MYPWIVRGEHGGSDEISVGSAVDGGFGPGPGGLTGWLDGVGGELSPAWRRRLGGSVVAAIGTLLASVPLYHLASHTASINALVGDTLPFAFGLVLLGVGAWLALVNDDDVAPLVTAFWVTVGLLATTLVSLYFLTNHISHGHAVESPWFLIYDIGATGAVAGLLISRYDVRSRRRHARVRRHERRFRAVFEGTLDALVVADDEGRCLEANPAAADLFGLPRADLVDRHVTEFTAAEDGWAEFSEDSGRRGEHTLVRPDGETRTVSVAATPNVLPGRHLAALQDVTDRVERESDLDRERARVEFLNRLLRHNVLNGMNLVLAKLDTLEPAVSPTHRDDVDAARRRSEEIVDLIQTARRLATDVSTEVGAMSVDVRDPLTEAVERVRTDYPDASIEFDAPEDPVEVHADGMVETAFEHLLTNAVEHNDTDAVTVSVGVDVDPRTVTITVADDGDGIPPERLAQLFTDEAFVHTRDWGGFGLSIVHALVGEYDGRVWAEPNEPSGVVVSVELRRADGAVDERPD